jgi:hypothetical protein
MVTAHAREPFLHDSRVSSHLYEHIGPSAVMPGKGARKEEPAMPGILQKTAKS